MLKDYLLYIQVTKEYNVRLSEYNLNKFDMLSLYYENHSNR